MDLNLKRKSGAGFNGLNAMSLSEMALFFLTLLLWIDRILLTYIRAVMLRIPVIGGMADGIIYTAYALLIVFSVPQILKCVRLSDLSFAFLTVCVCVLNYAFFPTNAEALDRYLPTFLFLTFPLYFIGLSLDFEKTYPWLYRLSLITIPAFAVHKLFVGAPMTEVQSIYVGDMWASYNLLPHACLIALAALKKPGVVNVAMAMMGIIMIASLGSRGPLLCIVMVVAVYLLLFKRYRQAAISYLLIAVVAGFVVINLDSIMWFLHDTAKAMGLSVRIFEKFFEGAISESSGRDIIAEQLCERIAERPLWGYGIFGDRAVIGSYAHQIVIEMWHAFGVLIGTAILGGIIVVLLHAGRVVKRQDRYSALFFSLLFAGFIKLFLSGSVFNEMCFFMLLGFSVKIVRRRNN